MLIRLFLFYASVLVCAGPVLAQDNSPAPDEAPQEAAGDDPSVALGDVLKDLSESLDPGQFQHFIMTYNNYNLISSVKLVKGEVSEAVLACGKKNPEMKEKLNARFGEWSEAVTPVIKEADININNMLLAQDYTEPEKIKNMFSLVEKSREHKRSLYPKEPATTLDACQYLLDKMDETQPAMITILRSTLTSYPRSTQTLDPEAEESPSDL